MGKSDEDKFIASSVKRLTEVQHLLLRSDTLAGSRNRVIAHNSFVVNPETLKPEFRDVEVTPGLLQGIVEMIMNVADHVRRLELLTDKDDQRRSFVTTIDVTMTDKKFVILNNGTGIKTNLHPEHGKHIPEILFTMQRASTNFNDSQKRTGVGRNGFGVKIATTFSKKFILETRDVLDDPGRFVDCGDEAKARKMARNNAGRGAVTYKQVFKNNLENIGAPSLKAGKELKGFTRLTMEPDWSRFEGVSHFTEDTRATIARVVFEVAAMLPKVRVKWNGAPMPVQDFRTFGRAILDTLWRMEDGDGDGDGDGDTPPPAPMGGGGGPGGPGGSGAVSEEAQQIAYHRFPDGTEVVVGSAPPSLGFTHFSYANCTRTGDDKSTHVAFLASNLSKALAKKASSKPGKGEDDSMMSRLGKTKVSVTPKVAESCLCLFINGVFDKPEFTGQTKQKLATPIGKLGFLGSAGEPVFKKLIKGAARSIDALRERAVSKEVEKLVRQANKGKRAGPSTGVSEDGSTRRVAYDVPKLVDANKAGTKEWDKCSLILTEGDSAKALAVVGMTKVTGQDYFGVLPLKGKFLNSRGMSTAKALVNDEVNRIRKSMGLEIGKDGDKCRRRYGRVIIMTDADDDGIHIQGLCINFFTYFWPKLAARPGFMQLFVTPLQRVFAIKGSAKGRRWMESRDVYDTMFNSKQESRDAIASWARRGESPGDTLQRLGLRMEYYKGLGTHEDEDAKLYFSNLDRHLFNIEYVPGRDDPHLDTAFLKSDASPEVRRRWMKDHSGATVVPLVPGEPVRVDEFINGNMVVYSFSVMPQHIPNVMDGLVESHGKVIYTSFNTSLNPKVKVAAFGGRTTTFAGYAHGDKSISDTITKAGQSFVGSNNVPFLVGVGQFGSRRWGGKDAASARYISVTTQDVLRLVFPKADDPVLTRVVEDGKQFQPRQYASVVPFLLFNGCSGTSTGWSTSIPAFNPMELCMAYGSCLNHLIAKVRSGERDAGDERSWRPRFHKSKIKKLVPWYHGFRGETTLEVEEAGDGEEGVQRVTWTGVVHWSSDTTLHILELPPGVWTNDVCDKLKQLSGKAVVPKKKALAAARKGGKAKGGAKTGRKRAKPGDDDVEENDEGEDEPSSKTSKTSKRKTFVVKGFTEHHFENNIHFKVHVDPSTARAWRDDPELMFKTTALGKLRRSVPLSNMVAIDPSGLPKRYTRVEHIMNDHFVERRRVYHLRHAHLLAKLEDEIKFLSERARFILLVLDKEIVLARKSREFVLSQLKKHDFSPRPTSGSDEPSFAYLCKMPIDSLTKEELNRLLAKRDKHQEEFDRLKKTLPEELWLADVRALLEGLRVFYKDDDTAFPPLDPKRMDLDGPGLTKAKKGRTPAAKRRRS